MRSPFPEEMNRRLTAPLVRWNFCPTEQARENLLSEAIDDKSCTVTGNTVVDALLWTRARLQGLGQDAEVIARLGVPPEFAQRYLANPKARWLLVTGHRRESFGLGFEQICRALQQLTERHPDLGVLYPGAPQSLGAGTSASAPGQEPADRPDRARPLRGFRLAHGLAPR